MKSKKRYTRRQRKEKKVEIGLNGLRISMKSQKAIAKNPSQETLKLFEKAAQK